MTDKEAMEMLEIELSYMQSHGGDRQAEALKIAMKAIKQIDRVLEVVERYKLRIPPTVYYELVADIMNVEGEE